MIHFGTGSIFQIIPGITVIGGAGSDLAPKLLDRFTTLLFIMIPPPSASECWKRRLYAEFFCGFFSTMWGTGTEDFSPYFCIRCVTIQTCGMWKRVASIPPLPGLTTLAALMPPGATPCPLSGKLWKGGTGSGPVPDPIFFHSPWMLDQSDLYEDRL